MPHTVTEVSTTIESMRAQGKRLIELADMVEREMKRVGSAPTPSPEKSKSEKRPYRRSNIKVEDIKAIMNGKAKRKNKIIASLHAKAEIVEKLLSDTAHFVEGEKGWYSAK